MSLCHRPQSSRISLSTTIPPQRVNSRRKTCKQKLSVSRCISDSLRARLPHGYLIIGRTCNGLMSLAQREARKGLRREFLLISPPSQGLLRPSGCIIPTDPRDDRIQRIHHKDNLQRIRVHKVLFPSQINHPTDLRCPIECPARRQQRSSMEKS